LNLEWKKLQNLRRILGRIQLIPLKRRCDLIKKGRINHMILQEEKEVREDVERRILEVEGVYLIFAMFVVVRVDMWNPMGEDQRQEVTKGRKR
jgi:hypothetical protein